MKWLGIVLALVVSLAGCTSASSAGHPARPPASASAGSGHSVPAVARHLADLDHSRRDGAYLTALHRLQHRCRAHSPVALQALASLGHQTLARRRLSGASYLSVVRSLAAGTAPRGPRRSCRQVLRELTAELSVAVSATASYGGYAATAAAWAAAHQADPRNPGGFLPRLANGDDSLKIAGGSRVTTLTRTFDPPLTQQVALSSVRQQLLPSGLHSVYTLHTNRCDEQIYLGPRLGKLLSSSSPGVMIELTSGHGISSRYDAALVDRAILTVGGRIGGQPCV